MERSKKIVNNQMNDPAKVASFYTELAARASLAGLLGQTYNGARDLYTALGYKKTLTFDYYLTKYNRLDIVHK
jgi:hypothetical protein